MLKTWQRIYQRGGGAPLVVRTIRLPRKHNLRVVLASDMHARDDWFPRECVRSFVETVNGLSDIDAVLLPGDFVGDDPGAADWAGPELSALRPATFATLGNHDHWSGPDRVATALQRAGIRMLTNESLEFLNGIWLAGIDSCWGGDPDPERALHGIPHEAHAIVLGHEPHIATMHDQYLHVAGHTHNGQVRPPLIAPWITPRWFPRFSQPYPYGLYKRGDDSYVCTTSGVGFSSVGWRLCCPPEVMVIEL